MERIREYIENKQYKSAYEDLIIMTEYKNMPEYHIYKAAALEGMGNVGAAKNVTKKALEQFADNYELAFMLGNYYMQEGQREKAYVWYLFAKGVCDNEDKAFLTENWKSFDTSGLDAKLVKDILQKLILDRFCLDDLSGLHRFVNEVVHSDDPFLFKQVIDTWLRYYSVILEISACEKNRGIVDVSARRFKDWKEFEKVLCEFKFAYRRIWFDFSRGTTEKIVELKEKYKVSPEFVVIMGKCAVYSCYTAAILKRASDIFAICGDVETSRIIGVYAEWFENVHHTLELVQWGENRDNGCEVIWVDAEEYEVDMRATIDDSVRNEQEVSYVMCANRTDYVDEVVMYLKRQKLPEGFNMKVYVVTGAKSMCAGYNVGMMCSDSRYKFYIHQDTFIAEENYTSKLIHYLSTTKYNMLGLAGVANMADTGRWWDGEDEKKLMCLYQDMAIYIIHSANLYMEETVCDVQVLDGVLLATNRDVLWREDLFPYFHFYDVSQCMEFQRKGYAVGFINVKPTSVFHEVNVDRGSRSEELYEESREVFVREYM